MPCYYHLNKCLPVPSVSLLMPIWFTKYFGLFIWCQILLLLNIKKKFSFLFLTSLYLFFDAPFQPLIRCLDVKISQRHDLTHFLHLCLLHLHQEAQTMEHVKSFIIILTLRPDMYPLPFNSHFNYSKVFLFLPPNFTALSFWEVM